GISDENGDLVLARLQEDETLRAAFRSVFGELLADDLEAIVDRDASASPPALILGNSVIVPNLPVTTSAVVNEGQASAASPGVPLIVPTDAFAARLTSELRGLELA